MTRGTSAASKANLNRKGSKKQGIEHWTARMTFQQDQLGHVKAALNQKARDAGVSLSVYLGRILSSYVDTKE
jgi:hypothetical protein